jgi:hypothetical protein
LLDAVENSNETQGPKTWPVLAGILVAILRISW